MLSIDDLRESVTDDQARLLSAILEEYLRTGEWIGSATLHSGVGRGAAKELLKPLGGSVVREIPRSGDQRGHYRLTLLGVLISPRGVEFENLLVHFLEYLCERFEADPEFDQVRCQDVARALDLTEEAGRNLGRVVIRTDYICGFSSGDGSGWTLTVRDNVDELADEADLRVHLQRAALKDYDADRPVNSDEAHAYYNTLCLRDEEEADEFEFVKDLTLRQVIADDWREARAVYDIDAVKSCIILCGSVLEGILLAVLLQREHANSGALGTLAQSPPKYLKQPRLIDLVEASFELKLLPSSSKNLGHVVREWRNLVHPGRQARDGVQLGIEQASIAINSVQLCINHLDERWRHGEPTPGKED